MCPEYFRLSHSLVVSIPHPRSSLRVDNPELTSEIFDAGFHATDVLSVFGKIPSPPTQEIQTRWIAFANTLNPDAIGFRDWPKCRSFLRVISSPVLTALYKLIQTDIIRLCCNSRRRVPLLSEMISVKLVVSPFSPPG